MNIIITGGGTAGHVNPLISIVNYYKKKEGNVNVLFVGTENGIERKLAENEGYKYEAIEVSGLKRSVSPKNTVKNIQTCAKTLKAVNDSKKIIKKFSPDIIICGGGYVSFPVTYAGVKKKIKTIVLEVNLVPGVTTEFLSKKCDKTILAFSETKKYMAKTDNVIVTGAPAKESVIKLTKSEAKSKLGLSNKPLVLSFWGSVGAKYMNEKMVDFVCKKDDTFNHIHATGKNGYDEFIAKTKGAKSQIFDYIYDMDLLMTASDLIICRAGASTLSELANKKKASIIVPSPYVAENHQEKNARILEKSDACKIMLEKEISGEDLLKEAKNLVLKPDILEKMAENIEKFSNSDSNETIYKTIKQLIS